MDTDQIVVYALRCRTVTIAIALFVLGLAGCIEKVSQPQLDESSDRDTSPPSETTTATGVRVMIVPASSFLMGNEGGADDERPIHQVTLSPFVMDKYEVTQDQYAELQLPNPAHFKGPRRPVEQVRWSDAALFCNERSRAEGLEPCYDEVSFECNFEATGYRLPTEAEWECVARAGRTDVPPMGVQATRQLNQSACYDGTASGQTQPVGERRPNAWGFHDLQGNVAEWCNDIYAADAYKDAASQDPRGPSAGPKRVLRGGSWKSKADTCRVTARVADDPGISDACFARNTYGFRCVRKLSASDQQVTP